MCSYNQVNGRPTCADKDLLKGIVRGEWRLEGYILSDCDSIKLYFEQQHFATSPEEAAAMALLAGVDVDCGFYLHNYTLQALEKGLLEESVVDQAISNSFTVLMRLGFFDGDPRNLHYGGLGVEDICSKVHKDLARDAARQGIVLLKNSRKTLPLSPTEVKSLAVIGPLANATEAMLGNYYGKPCSYTSPVDGLSSMVNDVKYLTGCQITCSLDQVSEAMGLAASSDATVLVMGEDKFFEQEGADRINLTLPGLQDAFVKMVANASKGPVVLVILSGAGLDIQFAKDDDHISSILWAGYPGEAGGAAIADVIFGYYNPGGRLPISWYPQSYVDSIPMTNMKMRPNPITGYPGQTYRFNSGLTVYDFAYGLSYSDFSYWYGRTPRNTSIMLRENLTEVCPALEFVFSVKNEGDLKGAEAVLVFSSPPVLPGAPRKQLVAFEKVFLEVDEEKEMTVTLDACRVLSVVDENGRREIAFGDHYINIGSLEYLVVAGKV